MEIPQLIEELREVESWEEGDEAVVDVDGASSGYMLYPSWASQARQATVAQANEKNHHSRYR